MNSLSARAQTSSERLRFLDTVQLMLLEGRLTMGQALRLLRRTHVGFNRREFGARVGISNTALTHLENDKGNPTLATVRAAFRPFGFDVGLIAMRRPPSPESQSLDRDEYEALAARIEGALDSAS